MRKHQVNTRSTLHRVCLMLLALSLILGIGSAAVTTRADTEVAAPNSSSIYIYNISQSWLDSRLSTAYILTDGLDNDAIYKVYNASGLLLGQGKQNLRDGYCAVTLYDSSTYNGAIAANSSLYVTRTVDGVESARTAVNAGKKCNPTITLSLDKVDGTKKLPTKLYTESSGFLLLEDVSENATLTAGEYYQASIKLDDFAAIDSVLIPLRYDTEILEPATIAYSASVAGNKLGLISGTDLTAAAEGLTFAMGSVSGYTSSLIYGATPGMAFQEWYKGSEWGSYSTPTTGGAYQSINTTTGLYKFQASVKTPAPFAHDNFTPSSSYKSGTTQFLRVFFRVKQTTTLTKLPVWFATEADCPAEAADSASQRLAYYDLASPNGISVTLGGANVTMPPLLTAATSEDTDAIATTLTATELSSLPEDYTFFNVYSSQLQANAIKVYNYTNSAATAQHSIDSENDHLVIESSNTIREGDTIRAYIHNGSDYIKVGEYSPDNLNEPIVDMDLGTDKLDPYGGSLYVTIERDTNGESPKVEVPYPKEATRNVTFRICRSDLDDSTAVAPYYANMTNMQAGTLLQLRIYFNNFYQLKHYGFALRFDPRAVQVADAEYQAVATGTVSEQSYLDGSSCLSPGSDLTDVTLTEQVIYQAQQRGDATEISQLIDQLGITQEKFDQIAADVALRYSIGVGNGASETPWRGGLFFTGEREDPTSSYPYVDNDNGMIQFMSASLEQAATIETENGYHFLSINFVVLNAYMDPGFRFAKDTDMGAVYSPAMRKGYQVIVSEGKADMGINPSWEVAPMGSTVTMTIADGNSNDPVEAKAVYLYQNAAYRDPGFTVKLASGQTVKAEKVRRYYEDAQNVLHDLPAYTEDEVITDFVIPDGDYSAHYTLYYEYSAPTGGDPVEMRREIYVIYLKGDVNRDGEINLFDEQALADHYRGYALLDLTDSLYASKTADVDQNGSVNDDDRELVKNQSLGLSTIQQDYVMPAG